MMLSSDKNVETIAQLAEVVKHYLGLQKEYLKVDIIDKAVRLLTALALLVILVLIVIVVVICCSFAIAFWLSPYLGGHTPAFFIVAIVHLIIFILFFAYRKRLIERPLVHFLTSLFMN